MQWTLSETVMEKVEHVVRNPWTNMLMGAILFATSLSEAWGTLYKDLIHLHLGAHHGVLIFGLFSMLKPVPDIFESLERMHRGMHE